MRTQVAIVGAGPAGLVLSHLLALSGIESVVLEVRDRAALETTVRAGILEAGTVDLLVETGVSDRVLHQGVRHDGILLQSPAGTARIDLLGLTGRSVRLYPQHEVLTDLLALGHDVRFEVRDVQLHDLVTDRPRVTCTQADGTAVELRCDVVAGCDGSAGVSRSAIPAAAHQDHFRAYPFAWYGILAEAPRSSEELVYAQSPYGFALVSSRTETLQRMYVQCDPAVRPEDWSDDRVWAELHRRLGDGVPLHEGPVVDRSVIPMRSYVCEPMRYGRLLLAGDAAHTVPPTGAKGLNLAVADVRVLARALELFFATGDTGLLDAYSDTALRRVWRAQHFSWWMTSMLHTAPDAMPFDVRRQLGELDLVTSSTAASTYLAEAYVGWPLDT